MAKVTSDRLIWAANVLLGYRVEVQVSVSRFCLADDRRHSRIVITAIHPAEQREGL